MKIMMLISLLTTAVLAAPMEFKADVKKSKVAFTIFKFKINGPVDGKFNDFTAGFKYNADKNELESITANIKVASIDTADAKRDGHLRTEDFFHADKFKEITFKSTEKATLKDGKGKIKGKLTMRGKTKDVILNVENKGTKKAPRFVATTKINRNDFGISWNKTFSLADLSKNVLADEVDVKLDIYSQK
jgi:polyisoprenoid-binding protein YceI